MNGWTTNKPTEAGFYYVKTGSSEYSSPPSVVRVVKKYHNIDSEPKFYYYLHGWSERYSVETEWQFDYCQKIDDPKLDVDLMA